MAATLPFDPRQCMSMITTHTQGRALTCQQTRCSFFNLPISSCYNTSPVSCLSEGHPNRPLSELCVSQTNQHFTLWHISIEPGPGAFITEG